MKEGKISKKESRAISMVRVIGTVMIFLLHLSFLWDNTVVNVFSQFLGVGVPVFFIISGYVLSIKGFSGSYFSWLKKRLDRLLPSYYIVLLLLLISKMIIGKDIRWDSFINNVFLFQGFNENYFSGAAHLWFMTHIVLCYLLFPLILRLRDIYKKNQALFTLSLCSFYFIGLFLLSIYSRAILCTVFASVCSFSLGVILLKTFLILRKYWLCLVIIFGIGLRLVTKIYLEEQVLYERFFAPISIQFIAIGLTGILFIIGSSTLVQKISLFWKSLLFIDKISYEIYLIHVPIIYIISSIWSDIPRVVFVLTVVLATMLLSWLISSLLKEMRRK